MNPDQTSTLKTAQKDAQTYAASAAFAKSEAGKLLIEEMSAEMADRIEVIANTYAKWSHTELIALCAALGGHLSLMKKLLQAQSNYELVKEAIDRMVKETPEK